LLQLNDCIHQSGFHFPVLFLPESGSQPVVVNPESNVEEGVVKALKGRWFVGFCRLNEVCGKDDK